VDVNKRVNFADDYNNKFGREQNGPSGDQIKAAIQSTPNFSHDEYPPLLSMLKCYILIHTSFMYYTDLMAAKVKTPGPDFNHTISKYV
jgi:hypothetical protein